MSVAAETTPLPGSMYSYIWRATRMRQIQICLLAATIVPLSLVPLEMQRRIVDEAIVSREIQTVVLLGIAYFAVVLLLNGVKFVMNMSKGRVQEEVARDLRLRVLGYVDRVRDEAGSSEQYAPVDEGVTISILASEAEDVGGFASESLSVPLLQAGTMVAIAGYLMWVEPLIALVAVLVYLPQAIVVPRVQRAINRFNRIRTWTVRKLGRAAVLGEPAEPRGECDRRRRARVLVDGVFAARMRIYARKFFLTLFGNISDALGPIIVLVLGGYLVIAGRTEVSTLVVFISGLHKLADPWDQLVNYYRSASNARVAYGLISDVLSGRLLKNGVAEELRAA